MAHQSKGDLFVSATLENVAAKRLTLAERNPKLYGISHPA
jgi:hypothetical protein